LFDQGTSDAKNTPGGGSAHVLGKNPLFFEMTVYSYIYIQIPLGLGVWEKTHNISVIKKKEEFASLAFSSLGLVFGMTHM
jgi:hypothetical protein